MQKERLETKYPLTSWAKRRMPTKTTNLQQVVNNKNVYRILTISFSSHNSKIFLKFCEGSIFKRFELFLTNQETFFYSTVTLLARFLGWSISVPLSKAQ